MLYVEGGPCNKQRNYAHYRVGIKSPSYPDLQCHYRTLVVEKFVPMVYLIQSRRPTSLSVLLLWLLVWTTLVDSFHVPRRTAPAFSTQASSPQEDRRAFTPKPLAAENQTEYRDQPYNGGEFEEFLLCDFSSIIVASQLIGLIRVVDNPQFYADGGWLQPIPALPTSSLQFLLQKIPFLSLCWFALGLVLSNTQKDSGFDSGADGFDMKTLALQISIYTVSLIALEVIFHPPGVSLALATGQALRDAYVSGAFLFCFRYLYRRLMY